MTVDDLNAYDRAAFVRALGWIFEESAWVAERAWDRRPFRSVDDLHVAMTTVVDTATKAEQLALLRAHPDLGTRARVSDVSSAEQQGAGLDRLDVAEFARMQQLNVNYRARFGFPFLFAVKGSTTHDVLAALEARIGMTRDAEFAEALRQVYKIAKFRLEEIELRA